MFVSTVGLLVTDELVSGHFKEQALDIARCNLYFFSPDLHENILSNVLRQILIPRSVDKVASEVVKVRIINHFKIFGCQLLKH